MIEYKVGFRNGYYGIDKYVDGKCIKMVVGLDNEGEAYQVCSELNDLAEQFELHKVQTKEVLDGKNKEISNLSYLVDDYSDQVDFLKSRDGWSE